MKSLFKSLLFVIALTALVSCKEDPKIAADKLELTEKLTEFDALKDEAIKVHDEVMPKMGELMALSEKMEAQLQKDTLVKEFKVAKSKLNGAHDDMMTWMKDYSEQFPYGAENPKDLEAIQSKLPVLEQQVAKIKAIRQETFNVIKFSKKLLTKVQTED